MSPASPHTLPKAERVAGHKLVDTLFREGRSKAAYPVRMVYTTVPRQQGQPAARIMVSVPKRLMKRAVKRNRVKRQLRESYRLNKHLLADIPGQTVVMAFIWMSDKLLPTAAVCHRVTNLLARLEEKP